MRTLKELIEDRKLFKEIRLFFDIETLQYNEAAGRIHPSKYKNVTYAVIVSWMSGDEVEYEIFPHFKQVFDTMTGSCRGMKKKPRIELIAHNNNKYDNHNLRKDLMYFYPHVTVENFFLTTATTDEGNAEALRIKDLTKDQREGIILEKRIKSSINLELTCFLYGQKFEFKDNWVKTNTSLKVLGDKLKKLGVVTDDELKTDFNYTEFNKDEDMTEDQARRYALTVFQSLTPDHFTYIRNDGILLAKSVYYYSDLFKGFSYDKITFTSNILESYNTNDLTSFQLLNRIGQGKEKQEVRYTDYQFANQNFYDWLKPFYRGGLNFYNQFLIGQILTCGVFGIDINSSYPYAMHKFKVPTYLKDYSEFETPTEVPIRYTDDEFTLFQLTKDTFDNLILSRFQSILLKQILVKYYTTNDTININTYTFKLIENLIGYRFESIPVLSTVTFETDYFGSRDQIEAFYKVKTQGKNEHKMIFNSPYDIRETDEPNTDVYSNEEIDLSKVNLNGLYGIPALRPYFNLFRKKGDTYVNIENGHKNSERNIVFSIFVTAVSVWNLLDPLKHLTELEIDENLIYCDTDSLYLKKAIQHKLPADLFHPYHLGKWDIEHDNIIHFYVLNHKKYAFQEYNNKKKQIMISVRSGGIEHSAFDTSKPFDEFIRTQFSHGVEITNTKSIYTESGTIAIYDSKTLLEAGKGYRTRSNSPVFDRLKQHMLEELKDNADLFTQDVLYVESPIGTFSLSDLFPVTHDVKQKEPLVYLEIAQEKIRRVLESS